MSSGSEKRWHADETRWMVFAETEGKIGHRWYLWVFHSESVIHFVLDPTRSAQVPIKELSDTEGGVVICDRYSGYKKLARILGTILLAFCWAHTNGVISSNWPTPIRISRVGPFPGSNGLASCTA